MRGIFALLLAALAASAEPIPARLFGQNVEHTRAAVQGGLSAQLVRNRKFAGKPTHDGVALCWTRYGGKGVFDHLYNRGYTRHAAKSRMFRQNEISSQFVSSLDPHGEAGIRQGGMALRKGVSHTVRAVVRAPSAAEPVSFVVRLSDAAGVLAERTFAVRSRDEGDWQKVTFSFVSPRETLADLSLGVKGRASAVIGVVSLLPDDSLRGMRRDVVERLREIGTSLVRWPGGNFAGEYRWRDGYMADPDERAPLQSYTEIETQTYSLGYDANDISPDDILALCDELGAEPFFTINAVWDTPADSAEWVSRCRGRVRLWSLGNEMGYGHMEGPKGPDGYVRLVRPHAEAMLKADPSIRLVSSGIYPGPPAWISDAAVPLAPLAPTVSFHHYVHTGLPDFTSDERTRAFFGRISAGSDAFLDRIRNFRAQLPRTIGISLDEWNLWYAWYREDGVAEGLFAAKTYHALLREWKALGLDCVCVFQAINECAIRVEPFSSRLTSFGEALRLVSRHAGRLPVTEKGLPAEAFLSDAPDGTRDVTLYNFSTTERRTFSLPAGNCSRIVRAECLAPNGLVPGSRLVREDLDAHLAEGRLAVTLPPASLAAVRLAARP